MGYEIPTHPDDGSASKRVFHKLYRIRAPYSLTLTREEIEMYGQRVSGIKDLDKYSANQMTTGRCTTVRMALIIAAGGSIQFCNKFDVEQCYGDLQQHIVNWEYLLATRYNLDAPPREDFEIFKELLDSLEVFHGLLDRVDTKVNPLGRFSVLNNSNFNRKGFSERVRIDPNHHLTQIKTVELSSWDDIGKMNRSL